MIILTGAKIIIRQYQPSDCREVMQLFYDTVRTINAKHYTTEQLNVWAPVPGRIDFEKWNRSLQEHYSVVAVDGKIITGFGDITETGYLDRLFVHTDYLRNISCQSVNNQTLWMLW